MAPIDRCLASAVRLSSLGPAVLRPSVPSIPRFLVPVLIQTRQASVVRLAGNKKAKKKKPTPKNFQRPNLSKRGFPQFSLCEAMRYVAIAISLRVGCSVTDLYCPRSILRASEVGEPPASVKYELHVNLKAMRNGPVVRGSIRLPNPVQSDWQIAVICPEGSDIANAATSAGAVAVGEESLFEAIREGKTEFDRLICHESSENTLNKAGLGRILGPKGLMPNHRNKTIVDDVVKSIRDSAGAAEYRERQGVVRLAVGQLGFTADQLKSNIQVLLRKVKAECAELSEDTPKEVHEVILSTTHGPALSLNGKFTDLEDKVTPQQLSGVM